MGTHSGGRTDHNPTESNLSPKTEHAGTRVVWLTTDPDCKHGHGLLNSLDGTDKTRVQIVIELPNRDVHKWKEWALRHGIKPEWLTHLTDAATAARVPGA